MSKSTTKVKGRTVAITGATGFVGARVLTRAVETGFRARILARTPSKARTLLDDRGIDPERVEIIEGGVSDPDALTRLVRGAHACIHLVGIIREAGHGQTFERIHIDATRAITHACALENRSMRYVHMSALGVGPDDRAGYRDSKHRAELVVKGSKLDWTIMRPGLIHGEHGEFTQMAAAWVRGKAPPFVFLPYFSRWKRDGFGFEAPLVAPVHVGDVADAFINAIDCGATIKTIEALVGPDAMTFTEMLRVYQRRVPGAKSWLRPIGLPWRVAALQARLAGALGLGGLLPFDEGMAIMGGRDSVADPEPATQDLGLSLAPFEETLAGYADSL